MQYTLLELNTLVQRAVQVALPAAYWLTAELSNWSVRGHAYGELVQKDECGQTVANARCTCWLSTYHAVKQKFFHATGGEIRAGMKVLLNVRPTFHPQYGFAYNILDIDPAYTMGDAARRRQEILRTLQREGIMRANEQNNPLPMLLQRIAVISSPTAAGYGDFCHQLLTNDSHLRFYPMLFPAVMQGNGVEESVLNALEAIADNQEDYDAVVIIRGGGAVTDLDCFDNYRLAEAVALFPLPVFTGIGHERDEVVLDFVAHTRLKTPTAVAAFLIDHNTRQINVLDRIYKTLTNAPRLTIEREKSVIDAAFRRIVQASQLKIQSALNRQDTLARTLPQHCLRIIERHQSHLAQYLIRFDAAHRMTIQRHTSHIDMLQQKFSILDPRRVLERGYSMTLCHGHLVTDVSQLSSGDDLLTVTATGTIHSVVNQPNTPPKPSTKTR